MTLLLLPASIRRCSAESRSFLLGPDGPAGAPPGHRLRSGVSIGQGEDGENKIRLNKSPRFQGNPGVIEKFWRTLHFRLVMGGISGPALDEVDGPEPDILHLGRARVMT